ncbi:unnamed protein product, partial [Closterium sp. NIES-54]
PARRHQLSAQVLSQLRRRPRPPAPARGLLRHRAYMSSAEWLRGDPRRTALGLDFDEQALSWGIRENFSSLPGSARGRACMLLGDVRDPLTSARFACPDVLDEPDGENEQSRREYTWEQERFDAVTRTTRISLHFRVPHDWAPASSSAYAADSTARRGGRKRQQPKRVLRSAFSYSWRLWTIPEVRELMQEAGFDSVHVWMRKMPDLADREDEEEEVEMDEHAAFEEVETFLQTDSWNAYVVGVVKPRRGKAKEARPWCSQHESGAEEVQADTSGAVNGAGGCGMAGDLGSAAAAAAGFWSDWRAGRQQIVLTTDTKLFLCIRPSPNLKHLLHFHEKGQAEGGKAASAAGSLAVVLPACAVQLPQPAGTEWKQAGADVDMVHVSRQPITHAGVHDEQRKQHHHSDLSTPLHVSGDPPSAPPLPPAVNTATTASAATASSPSPIAAKQEAFLVAAWADTHQLLSPLPAAPATPAAGAAAAKGSGLWRAGMRVWRNRRALAGSWLERTTGRRGGNTTAAGRSSSSSNTGSTATATETTANSCSGHSLQEPSGRVVLVVAGNDAFVDGVDDWQALVCVQQRTLCHAYSSMYSTADRLNSTAVRSVCASSFDLGRAEAVNHEVGGREGAESGEREEGEESGEGGEGEWVCWRSGRCCSLTDEDDRHGRRHQQVQMHCPMPVPVAALHNQPSGSTAAAPLVVAVTLLHRLTTDTHLAAAAATAADAAGAATTSSCALSRTASSEKSGTNSHGISDSSPSGHRNRSGTDSSSDSLERNSLPFVRLNWIGRHEGQIDFSGKKGPPGADEATAGVAVEATTGEGRKGDGRGFDGGNKEQGGESGESNGSDGGTLELTVCTGPLFFDISPLWLEWLHFVHLMGAHHVTAYVIDNDSYSLSPLSRALLRFSALRFSALHWPSFLSLVLWDLPFTEVNGLPHHRPSGLDMHYRAQRLFLLDCYFRSHSHSLTHPHSHSHTHSYTDSNAPSHSPSHALLFLDLDEFLAPPSFSPLLLNNLPSLESMPRTCSALDDAADRRSSNSSSSSSSSSIWSSILSPLLRDPTTGMLLFRSWWYPHVPSLPSPPPPSSPDGAAFLHIPTQPPPLLTASSTQRDRRMFQNRQRAKYAIPLGGAIAFSIHRPVLVSARRLMCILCLDIAIVAFTIHAFT